MVVIVAFICCKRYYVPKSVTGEIILSLCKSNRIIIRRGIGYIVVLCMITFKYPYEEISIATISGIALSVIILIEIAWFDFQPQKICRNGILTKTGFISWNMIKKVEPVSDMDDTIVIQLHQTRFGDRRFKLYCLPGMGNIVEQYINQYIYK